MLCITSSYKDGGALMHDQEKGRDPGVGNGNQKKRISTEFLVDIQHCQWPDQLP